MTGGASCRVAATGAAGVVGVEICGFAVGGEGTGGGATGAR
ncbi:MAG: hypothetical protein ACYS9X_25130 [Planctomycetota bacterium]